MTIERMLDLFLEGRSAVSERRPPLSVEEVDPGHVIRDLTGLTHLLVRTAGGKDVLLTVQPWEEAKRAHLHLQGVGVLQEPRFLEVVRIEDREVVRRLDVTGQPERTVERTLAGMLLKADTEDYFIRDTADPPQQEEESLPSDLDGGPDHELDRQVAEILGWTDFIPRKGRYQKGYLAKPPGARQGRRRETVPMFHYSAREIFDYLVQEGGQHGVRIESGRVVVTRGDKRSAAVRTSEDAWRWTRALALAFVLVHKEGRP